MSEAFPNVSELVPHAGPMLLVDSVLHHDESETRCRVRPEQSALFAGEGGDVPAWVGLEYMAQCAAVHGGLASRTRGEPPRPGLFLGSRRLRLHAPAFSPGETLEVVARHHHGDRGLVTFDCRVEAEDQRRVVEGRINLYILNDWSELGEGAPVG